MDIEYLYFLQNFRNNTDNMLSPFMLFMSDLIVSIVPFSIVILIYLVFDRQYGKKVLMGFGLSCLFNEIVKLTACVYRPWIRDPKIVPYGNAINTSTSYSFPSGHTTCAVSIYGGIAGFVRRYNKILSFLILLLIPITMFSRNYLGVHTPQDVIVAFFETILVMYFSFKIEEWTNKDIKRDFYLIIITAIFIVALLLYLKYKPYPLDYKENGELLVNPKDMLPDIFCYLGWISAYMLCRYFERRFFNFDKELNKTTRLIVGIILLIPLSSIFNCTAPFLSSIHDVKIMCFVSWFLMAFYIMILIPLVYKIIYIIKCKIKNNKINSNP